MGQSAAARKSHGKIILRVTQHARNADRLDALLITRKRSRNKRKDYLLV